MVHTAFAQNLSRSPDSAIADLTPWRIVHIVHSAVLFCWWAYSIVYSKLSPCVVRSANSKPELSQLLFISVRQRELIKSSRWIGLPTYTSTTWSVHYFPALSCDPVTCDVTCDRDRLM